MMDLLGMSVCLSHVAIISRTDEWLTYLAVMRKKGHLLNW
jgi:hypothetical protein